MKEPIFEPILRRMRIARVLPFVKRYPACELLDVGCGWEAKLLKSLESIITSGIGIDRQPPKINTDKIKTVPGCLETQLPFPNESFNFVTMLAVLEHINDEVKILNECKRVLQPGGGILITVPSWRAKPILEFLSFNLGLINKSEIEDHKRYYNREDLLQLINKIDGLRLIEHRYFQFGMNNCVFLVKQ